MNDFYLPNMGGHTMAKRLAVRFLEDLRSGAFDGAVRLPSELDLAERYGVSRSVMRDALAELTASGYVERGRGVGTVVNREIVDLRNRLDMKFEYSELIRQLGGTPSTDVIQLYQQPADEQLAEKLAIDLGAPLIVCEKRVKASGTPVIYSIDHLPEALFKHLNWRALDWALPVFELLSGRCGVEVNSSITRLAAALGPQAICQKLDVSSETPLILLDEVGYYKLGYPILHSLGFYTSFFDFSLLRKNF